MSKGMAWTGLWSAAVAVACLSGAVYGQGEGGGEGAKESASKPEFPPFKEVAKDYEQVVSTADGKQSFYTVWRREKDGQLLAELPRGFAGQKHFFAMTIARGDTWAGLQGGTILAYWKRFDKNLALIVPNLDTRSTGDPESKSGVEQQFTDRVLLDVPIVCMGPSGQPVIDLDALLAGQAGKFFPGGDAAGANPRLCIVKEAKAFPENVEISLEMPVSGGQLRTFHYSISLLPESTGYKPRQADERIGFFTTAYRDLGQFADDKKWVRNIRRWHLEKRDPSLSLSPPKEPIVFYVEHTVPVRYRRWVRQGVLEWNKAFEKVGIVDAIEVYYQDKSTGAHMEKDPEDVRYNFVRWVSNDISTAIGPSRVDPRTGQILDADVLLTDGWIRVYWYQANQLLPDMATAGMGPELLGWLDKHPKWDPRLRLVDPVEAERVLTERTARGVLRYGGLAVNPDGAAAPAPGEDPEASFSRMCMAARGKGFDMARARMHLELMGLIGEEGEDGEGDEAAASDEAADDKDKKDKKKEDKEAEKAQAPEKKADVLDGIPEWFVGPMLMDLVAHEIGHTLGLRHNFKASGAYALGDINSEAFKGKRPFVGSVMDYTPVNINKETGAAQGDYAPIGIGPYDYWVIEYGYTSGDPKKVLERVAEPELAYLTDEDVGGPDPLAQQYDLSANPLDYARNQMRLVEFYRSRIIDKFVKDGESWSKARRGYLITLGEQVHAVRMMSTWVGGAHVNRDRKGDPNGRDPIQVVPAARQREALQFIIDWSFRDEAFGLTPDLLRRMTVDKWYDRGGMRDLYEDATFPVHDRVIGIQATALTLLINPVTLARVYDNEFRVPADQDALTLPELMNTVSAAIWTELDASPSKQFTPRQPMVSSLRRNLQREHLDRLIDLALPGTMTGAAAKPVSNLATLKLREIRGKIKSVLEGDGKSKVDDYTVAHLSEAAMRIDQTLESTVIYNTDKIGGGGMPFVFMFGEPSGDGDAQRPAMPAPLPALPTE